MKLQATLLLFAVLMAASFDVIGEQNTDLATLSVPDDFPVVSATPAYEILFIGNSHSAANDLPGLVTTLIKTGVPEASAQYGLAPGFLFLADRIDDGVTQPLLQSRSWSHVILQAQKYSSSGQYFYPTHAAEEWIRRATSQNARPILFPEWPRRGNTEEGQRVHNLHLDIATRESACVAPVGLAWEASIAQYPGLNLHAADGNHANLNGALLTAFVFYQVITLQSAADLPYVPSINVSANTQQQLREAASAVVENNQATCVEVGASQAAFQGIPSLSNWSLVLMAMALAFTGTRKLHHRAQGLWSEY